MKDRYILAFETSCDETSVAVLKNDDELLSNVIASQIESHKRFGGVVPEVASRHHVEVITACIEEALAEAGITEEDVTAVAVTYGPGLVGALLVGLSAARPLLGRMVCHLSPSTTWLGTSWQLRVRSLWSFLCWRS